VQARAVSYKTKGIEKEEETMDQLGRVRRLREMGRE